MIALPTLSEFVRSSETFRGKTRTVYHMGKTGPGVLLTHETPGITPQVLRLAKLLTVRGFRVALPSLFGTDGEEGTQLLDGEMLLRMCVSAEFAVFASNGSSPVVNWLRDFGKSYAATTGGPIGAIGLCITGGFALSLVVGTNGLVRAPVMSEPSLPFPLPFTHNQSAIHLTVDEQASLRTSPPPCVALRFTGDYRCKRERFDAYQELLGDKLMRIEIPSPDPPFNITADAHSVLTNELSDVGGHPTWTAFERVVTFLTATLSANNKTPL
jgi:dienelactone hydrolase